MKAIKFYMSNKEEFVFDEIMAEAIIDSANQIVKIEDANGKWTGQTLNKAHIILTKPDWEETKHLERKEDNLMLEEPEKDTNQIKDFLEKYRPESIKNNEK